MTEKNTYHKLPDDECIGEEMMYRYIDGKLNSAEMHHVESHTLECGLCADALEGLANVKERDRKGGYFRLPEGTGAGNAGKIISFWSRPALYYSAAACVLLLVGFFTLKNFVSSDVGSASPSLAEANQSNRFVPENKQEDAATDSIALPDNTKISVRDLEESIGADSAKTALDQSGSANSQGPASTLASTNTEDSRLIPLEHTNTDLPNVVVTKDQPKASAANDATVNTSRNAQIYTNTVTNQAVVMDDLKKNKNDKDPNRAEAVPASTSGAGSNSEVADNADSQVGTDNVADEVSTSSTSTTMMNSSGSVMPASDTTTYFSAQQSQPNLHPNQETDADVTDSYNAGLKMLAQNNPQGSLIFFDDVIAHPSNANYADAQWKKVEALLLLGKKDDAKILLNRIVSEGGKYKTQAEDKLKTL